MPTRPKLSMAAVLALCLICAGVASASTSHHKRRHRSPKAALASMGAEPSPSIFGIDTSIYDSNHGRFLRDIPTARRLGSRWDRFTVDPPTARGTYSTLDWEVKTARRNGMGAILSLGGISGACSLSPRPSNIHACPPTTSRDLRVYQAYVRRLVIHYRRVVQYYESWTEENNKSSWLPGPNAARYAALLRTEYAAIQSVNRQYGLHIKLLFGSPTGFSVIPGTPGWKAVLPFTNKVLRDLHGAKPFDGVALHAYRFPPEEYGPGARAYDYVGGAGGPFHGCDRTPWCQMTWSEELEAYEQEFIDHGDEQLPMWLTEFGWPGDAQPSGSYYPSQGLQAEYLREAYDDLLSLPFVKGALWFNVRDYQPGYVSPDPRFFYYYGLLNYNLSLKPAATEFRQIAGAHPDR
jgi:hypothetical protein